MAEGSGLLSLSFAGVLGMEGACTGTAPAELQGATGASCGLSPPGWLTRREHRHFSVVHSRNTLEFI